MNPIVLVIALVAIVVLGGLAREYIKGTRASREAFGKEMKGLKQRMEALEAAMEVQKELVADAVIEKS